MTEPNLSLLAIDAAKNPDYFELFQILLGPKPSAFATTRSLCVRLNSTPRFAEEYIPQTMLKEYQQAYKEVNELPKQLPLTGNNKVTQTELDFVKKSFSTWGKLNSALSIISFHLKVIQLKIQMGGLSELPNKDKPFDPNKPFNPNPVETAAKIQDTLITAPVPTSRATPLLL